MYLTSSAFLAAALLFSSAHAADGLIRFCNDSSDHGTTCPADKHDVQFDIDPKTGTKQCIDAPNVNWEQCVVIPDFNAKGDKGSCGQALMDTGTVNWCYFYEDTACKEKPYKQGYRFFLTPEFVGYPETTIFRSVKCLKDHASK